MKYINEALYKKVYILEFKKNLIAQETFAFSLPPQSEEFNYTERISETKTFGGIVFEDYGNDTVKISLSGTTANNDMKIVYGNIGKNYSLTGEEEISKLREIIRKWGEQDRLKNKSIILTNLMTGDRWQVLVASCKVRRSKENPFAYFYNLELIGISETVKQYINRIAKIETPVDKILTWMDKVKQFSQNIREKTDAITAEIQKAFSPYTNMYKYAQDSVLTIQNLVDSLDYSAEKYISTFNGFIDPAENGFNEVVGYTKTLIGSAYRLLAENSLDIVNDAKKVSVNIHDFVSTMRDFIEDPKEFAKSLKSEIIDEFPSYNDIQEVAEEIKDTWVLTFDIIEDMANEMSVDSLKNKDIGYACTPGGMITDDSSIAIYGFSKKIVTDNDTWDGIAEKELGNADLGSTIALYNKDALMTDNGDLKAGMTILIPVINPENSIALLNMIYPQVDEKDNYGKDIKLKQNDINIGLDGDIAMTSGFETLAQSLQSRLCTDIDTRIRIVFFGIKAYIGNPNASQNLIRISIEETVLADPRVLEIENISFKGQGDSLFCSFVYTDINHIQHEFGGII